MTERNRKSTNVNDNLLSNKVDTVRKHYGENAIVNSSNMTNDTLLPTGIYPLDYCLNGGLTEGTMNMLYGYESSGKTTVALKVISQSQKKYPDKTCVYVDLEQTLDKFWVQSCGVDLDRLLVAKLYDAEQAIDAIVDFASASDVGVIVVDSLPALAPTKILEKSAYDATMAVRAALVGNMCTRLYSAMTTARDLNNVPTIIFINQWRVKLGQLFGDPRTLPCGAKPRYASKTMIEIKKVKENTITNDFGDEVVDYNDIGFVIAKHKGASIKQGEFKLIRNAENELGSGFIDDYKQVTTIAKKYELVTGGGSSWKIKGVEQKFGRLSEIHLFFKQNLEFYNKLKRDILITQRQRLKMPALPNDKYLLFSQ